MSASTNKEPAAIGSYSGFRHSGRLLITSGQLSLNPKTNRIEATGFHDQALQCLENIHCILQSEQMNFSDVLKLTVYMTDLAAFSQVNQAFMESMARPYPAGTAV